MQAVAHPDDEAATAASTVSAPESHEGAEPTDDVAPHADMLSDTSDPESDPPSTNPVSDTSGLIPTFNDKSNVETTEQDLHSEAESGQDALGADSADNLSDDFASWISELDQNNGTFGTVPVVELASTPIPLEDGQVGFEIEQTQLTRLLAFSALSLPPDAEGETLFHSIELVLSPTTLQACTFNRDTFSRCTVPLSAHAQGAMLHTPLRLILSPTTLIQAAQACEAVVRFVIEPGLDRLIISSGNFSRPVLAKPPKMFFAPDSEVVGAYEIGPASELLRDPLHRALTFVGALASDDWSSNENRPDSDRNRYDVVELRQGALLGGSRSLLARAVHPSFAACTLQVHHTLAHALAAALTFFPATLQQRQTRLYSVFSGGADGPDRIEFGVVRAGLSFAGNALTLPDLIERDRVVVSGEPLLARLAALGELGASAVRLRCASGGAQKARPAMSLAWEQAGKTSPTDHRAIRLNIHTLARTALTEPAINVQLVIGELILALRALIADASMEHKAFAGSATASRQPTRACLDFCHQKKLLCLTNRHGEILSDELVLEAVVLMGAKPKRSLRPEPAKAASADEDMP